MSAASTDVLYVCIFKDVIAGAPTVVYYSSSTGTLQTSQFNDKFIYYPFNGEFWFYPHNPKFIAWAWAWAFTIRLRLRDINGYIH